MEYFVYIIYSKASRKYYTGITSNLHRRLREHNRNKSSTKTTNFAKDFKVVFCQVVPNRFKARKLEKYLKSGSGRELRAELVKYT